MRKLRRVNPLKFAGKALIGLVIIGGVAAMFWPFVDKFVVGGTVVLLFFAWAIWAALD